MNTKVVYPSNPNPLLVRVWHVFSIFCLAEIIKHNCIMQILESISNVVAESFLWFIMNVGKRFTSFGFADKSVPVPVVVIL